MTSETWLSLSQLVIAVGLVLAALGGYGAYYFGKRIETEASQRSAVVGVLRSNESVIVSAKENIWPAVEFGDSGSILKFMGPTGMPLIDFGDDTKLTVVSDAGQIKVSLVIRDKSGKLVAEIERNEWKVNPHNSWDRNYTSDALEVRDPRGDVVLQVKVLANRIQLQAKFFDANGRGIGFGKIKGPNGWDGVLELTGPNHPNLELKIQPMFKYPSDRHFGELALSKDV